MLLLATLNELAIGQTKEFDFYIKEDIKSGFLIRTQNGYRAYLNRCPHRGVSLNWRPNQFLSVDGSQIQCATHGARFNLSNGTCEGGPCGGQSLIPLPLKITVPHIYLDI